MEEGNGVCVRRTGETVVGVGEHKGDVSENGENTGGGGGGRSSSVESWDFGYLVMESKGERRRVFCS